MSLFSGLATPLRSFSEILRDSFAAFILLSQFVLSLPVYVACLRALLNCFFSLNYFFSLNDFFSLNCLFSFNRFLFSTRGQQKTGQ